MENSFTNWRSTEKKDTNDSDESDSVRSPENSTYNQSDVIKESDLDDEEFQNFNKISNVQSSTRIERTLKDDSDSIDSENNTSYTGWRSEKDDEEADESEDSNADSDDDILQSSRTKSRKSNNNLSRKKSIKSNNTLTKTIIVDDSDKEEGSSDSDSLILGSKKKNRNIISSDSETEEINNVEDSATDSKKNATNKKSSFIASSGTNTRLGSEKDDESDELEDSNADSDEDVIESSIIISGKSNSNRANPIIIDDSDKEEGSSLNDREIKSSALPELQTKIQKSFEQINISGSSLNKSRIKSSALPELQIKIEKSSDQINLSGSSVNKSRIKSSASPKLQTKIQKSFEHINISGSSLNKSRIKSSALPELQIKIEKSSDQNDLSGSSVNKSRIKSSASPKLQTKIQKSFEHINISGSSLNKSRIKSSALPELQIKIEKSSDQINLSGSSVNKSRKKSSASPKLQTKIQKSFEHINISGSSVNKSRISEHGSMVSNKNMNSFRNEDGVIIDSDSDDHHKVLQNQSLERHTSRPVHLDNVSGSSSSTIKTYIQSKLVPNPVQEKLKTDIGDGIRVQQLLAEQKRLEFQIGKSREEITKTKTTLRTADLPMLPDKGQKLHLALARQETGLRDLLIQETLLKEQLEKISDELIDQVNKSQIQVQENQQPQWSKLPSAMVNLNEMGKKALETHRTQQALTVEALTRLHNSLKSCPSEETETTDPLGLTIDLMPHQKHALAWLLWREGEKPSGGILADDMGLGKTLTMISLILKAEEVKLTNSIREENVENDNSDEDEEENIDSKSNWLSKNNQKTHRGKTLVVCPATIIGQWEREITNRVKPNLLRVEMYHGPNREKRESRLTRRDVVITTYNIVGRENDGTKGPIFNIRWERIILDEAHQIRNHKSKTALGAYALRGKNRWALTGTPIHNKELDLYALLKFIRCSPFDDLAVWKFWVDNRDAAGKQRLGTMVKALMLRRTKEDLQNKGSLNSLPTKEFSTVEVHLNSEEQLVYQKILDFSKTLLAQFIEQKAEKEAYYGHMPVNNKTRYKYDAVEDAFSDHPDLAKLHQRIKNMADLKTTDIFVLLLRLRQICCHPCLIKAMLNKEEIMNVGIEDNEGLDMALLEKMGDITLVDEDNEEDSEHGAMLKISPLNPSNPIFSPDKISSKIKAVVETLDKCILNTEDKAVIVSQWSSMLDLIYNVLKSKKIKCVLLTGSVPVKIRGGIVEEFNQVGHGPKVMLLSLTAGGVGLNLVGANHLLMVDLHWNPQLEAQACDRIYRVGQKKQVHIYKFLCTETIEERILKLQQKKLDLAQNVLTGTNIAQASKLSLDDLKMLFGMK